MEQPIRLKVNPRCQRGDLFIYKEGEGMCQNRVVHFDQLGFGDDERVVVSFEVELIPKIIEALKNIPTLTEKNQKTFIKDMEKYFYKHHCNDCFPEFFGESEI